MIKEQIILETTTNDSTHWQTQLSSEFRGQSGLVADRLSSVLDAERSFSCDAAQKTCGFTILMNCFQEFCLQTHDEMYEHEHTKNINVCGIIWSSFRRLRYALQGFYHGYPYDAAANLRPLFENMFFLGAVLHGYVGHADLFAFSKDVDYQNESYDEITRKQQQHLRKLNGVINSNMRGDKSDLPKDDQKTIKFILGLLHTHVHRTESSIMEYQSTINTDRFVPRLEPTFDLNRANHFATHAVYATWLMHRVLPFISYPHDYSDSWKQRQKLLDQSFQSYVTCGQGSGFDAFCRMMDARFTFDIDESWKHVKIDVPTRTARIEKERGRVG